MIELFNWINTYMNPFAMIATFIGAFVAYITWINPLRRMRWFMFRRKKQWKKRIYTDKEEYEQWVFQPNPAFRIHSGKVINDNFIGNEPWLPKTPKGKRNITFEVHVIANGIRLDTLTFIGMDDIRLFIPLPQINKENGTYYYSSLQMKVYEIIGIFNSKLYGNDIKEFAKNNKIEILKPDLWGIFNRT